jgi:hypothetical protein
MRNLSWLAMLVATVGCSASGKLHDQHPDWSVEDCDRLVEGITWVGMTEEQLRWIVEQDKAYSDSWQRRHGNLLQGSKFDVQETSSGRVYIETNRHGHRWTWTVNKGTGTVSGLSSPQEFNASRR